MQQQRIGKIAVEQRRTGKYGKTSVCSGEPTSFEQAEVEETCVQFCFAEVDIAEYAASEAARSQRRTTEHAVS